MSEHIILVGDVVHYVDCKGKRFGKCFSAKVLQVSEYSRINLQVEDTQEKIAHIWHMSDFNQPNPVDTWHLPTECPNSEEAR